MRLLLGRPIELLCLDLDDTLLDTEAGAPRRFASAIDVVRSIRPDIAAPTIEASVDRGLLTHPTEGRIVNFLADLGITEADDIAAVRAAYFDRMSDGLRLFDGASEVLATLRDHFRTAIITNGPSALQREKIDRFNLQAQVDWIVVSAEVGSEKPDRAIFEHTMSLARVEAHHAAHVGDSLTTDVAGANDAGLLSIWLRSPLMTARPDDCRLTPHATIDHLRDLPGLIAPT